MIIPVTEISHSPRPVKDTKRMEELNNLGVTVSQSLNFSTHIEKTAKHFRGPLYSEGKKKSLGYSKAELTHLAPTILP